jgi:hypothetical protein
MILFAWIIHSPRFHAGAVNINLFIVGLFDMPLFVITVIYGLAWKRVNWQGALGGFICGGLAAMSCYVAWPVSHARKIAPIVGGVAALIITPIIALLTRPAEDRGVFASMHANADDGDSDPFKLIPLSLIGKLASLTVIGGMILFFAGVFAGGAGVSAANAMAVAGMLLVFVGGAVRVYSK